jgi:nucleoside-diphosphate kinase
MAIQYSLVMIKPPHSESVGEEMLLDLDSRLVGERLLTSKVTAVTIQEIQGHYLTHREQPFFRYVCEFFEGKPIDLPIYRGEEIIKVIRKEVGATDPAQALAGTLRSKWCVDSFAKAMAESRPVENGIHASDSIESAIGEILAWKNYLDIERFL